MNGKIKIDMSLHAEYTNSEQTARELAEITQQTGTGMHVHVSETKKEVMECRKRHGKTPVRFLADLGLFDTRTIAAHCVWLDDEDYEILKEKGVFGAVNPVSNLKLASGVANVPEMQKRGIDICIGTDSVTSNNSLDFLEEMKIFAIASKMYYCDPSVINADDVLRAATLSGAECQGRTDTGRLKAGLKADLVVLDISGPNMHPLHSLKNNILYSAGSGDVLMTMVDGKVLYENGEYTNIDIEKVIYETERLNAKILSEL
jgi:5-methylthioadenosine/S-adenosylhomocysteine deaminase